MTPGQLALLTRGEAALEGNAKTKTEELPEPSDVDDMVAFAAMTSPGG